MINRVVLVGRLTKDPELRYTQTNKAVCNFTLAVNDYGDKVDFLDVVCWEKTAEFVGKYLRKGALTGVDGKLKKRKYEAQDGTNRYVVEVLAQNVKGLESKPKDDSPKQEKYDKNAFDNNMQTAANDSFDPFANNDDIPPF